MSFKADLKASGGSLHTSDIKKVLSVKINPNWQPQLLITVTDKLPIGVPVQVQFEIIPQTKRSGIAYIYTANIKSIKARIKPGTLQFVDAEEKSLNHILNGTEKLARTEERILKRIEKAQNEGGTFRGIEIDDT